MDAKKAAEYLTKHVKLGHGGFSAWGAQCRFSEFCGTLVMAVDFLTLPNRDTGRPELLTVNFDFTWHQLKHWNEKRLLHEFRHMLIFFVEHEVDESIMVDGKREFDPHREVVRQPPPVEVVEPVQAMTVAETHKAIDLYGFVDARNASMTRLLVDGEPPGKVALEEVDKLKRRLDVWGQAMLDIIGGRLAMPPPPRKWMDLSGLIEPAPRMASVVYDEFADYPAAVVDELGEQPLETKVRPKLKPKDAWDRYRDQLNSYCRPVKR